MSLKVSQRVWEHSHTTGSVRLLMLALADYAREDGVAWPSLRSLAVKTNTSKRNVIRLVQKAQAAGELDVAPGGVGRGDRTTYRLNPERVTVAPPIPLGERVTEPTPIPERKSDAPARKGDKAADKGDTQAERVTGRSSPSRTVSRMVSQNGQANTRARALSDDPNDANLVASLRRSATSMDGLIAENALKRLRTMGVAITSWTRPLRARDYDLTQDMDVLPLRSIRVSRPMVAGRSPVVIRDHK